MSALLEDDAGRRDVPARWIVAELRLNAPIYFGIFLFFIGSWMLAQLTSTMFWPALENYGTRIVGSMKIILPLFPLALAVRAVLRPRSLTVTERILSDLQFLYRYSVATKYLFASLLLAAFMAAFLHDKMLIPVISPYSWDATFAAWDRAVFMGRHPWEILHPFLGFPIATNALDVLYALWVPLVFIFWGGLFASPSINRDLRNQYWISTLLCWIVLGLVLATLLSSAGPCYYTEIVGAPSPYAKLDAYLADVSKTSVLGSSALKDYLWAIYEGRIDAPGGISAMPSMHNAQATLFALAALSINRYFGIVMIVYAVAIFVGSVHLGWHYGIDSIAGCAGALAVWHGVAVCRRKPWAGRVPPAAA